MAFKNLGIGSVIFSQIARGLTNEQICKELAARKDSAKFATVLSNRSSHLGWYRAKAKKNAAANAERATQVAALGLSDAQIEKLRELGAKL